MTQFPDSDAGPADGTSPADGADGPRRTFATPVPAWVWVTALAAWPALGLVLALVVLRESRPAVLGGIVLGFALLALAVLAYARSVAVIVEQGVLRVRPGGPGSMHVPVEEVRDLRVLRSRAEVRAIRNDMFFAALRRHVPVWADQAVVFTAPYRPGRQPQPVALYCEDVDGLARLLGASEGTS